PVLGPGDIRIGVVPAGPPPSNTLRNEAVVLGHQALRFVDPAGLRIERRERAVGSIQVRHRGEWMSSERRRNPLQSGGAVVPIKDIPRGLTHGIREIIARKAPLLRKRLSLGTGLECFGET